jgi:hypothetical protein
MINVVSKKFSIARFSKTIHFGKNPKKGGRPPSDRRLRKIKLTLEALILINDN